MKKYYISKVEQNGKEFYVLISDPRVIAKMILNVKAGQPQDTQRPWNEGRVREIAKYVAGKFKEDDNKKAVGLIPNAPILNIKKKIEVEKDTKGYYILLPETKSEFKQYSETIEVIDGQHRIRAFMEDFIDVTFAENKKYEMVFTLFDKMADKEKREIFMITNEKQETVPPNLLRMFKRDLGLLKGDEVVYDLVSALNKEDFSPLKGRIMIGSDKITKGYQEIQVSKILNKSDTFKALNVRKYKQVTMAKIISNYLRAWEKTYNVKFNDPGKDTITKISGLRYIFFLFPTCLDILENRKKSAKTDEFKILIDLLPEAVRVDDVFTDPVCSPSFRGEGATIQLAKDHTMKLKAYEQQKQSHYDIAEGI